MNVTVLKGGNASLHRSEYELVDNVINISMW